MIKAASQIQESERFLFPTTFHYGCKFTPKALVTQLSREASAKNIPQDMFREIYTPSKRGCERVSLQCKSCTARLLFIRKDKQFYLAFIDNNHLHHKDVRQSTVVGEEMSSIRKHEESEYSIPLCHLLQELDGRVNEALKDRANTLQQYKQEDTASDMTRPDQVRPLKQLRKPNDFDLLAKWLIDHKYIYEIRWTDQSERTYSLPQTILLFSENMLTNIDRYGDVVSVEVRMDQMISICSQEEHYNTVVFAVGDKNERPLMAGLALCATLSKENIGRAVLMFMEKCKRRRGQIPTCYISKEERNISEGLNWVGEKCRQAEPASTIHQVFDLEFLLGRAHLWLRRFFEPERVNEIIRILGLLTRTYDRNTFTRKWNELGQDSVIKELLDDLEPERHKIFLSYVGETFVGLQRTLCYHFGRAVDEHFPSSLMQVKELLDNVGSLDATLKQESERTFQTSEKALKKHQHDKRLRELGDQCERVVVVYFLEQYEKADRNMVCVREYVAEDGKAVNVVKNQETGHQFEIKDWVCECGEYMRTGLPCDHLICMAIITKGKSYCDLIHPRWFAEAKSNGDLQEPTKEIQETNILNKQEER